jgi:hypothetical protein
MLYKKAQVEVQFNWIFVIIVGVIFLSFFFMYIANRAEVSEQKISVGMARHFRTIIDSTSQKSGTVKEYTLPAPVEIKFICNNEYGLYNYMLNDVKVDDIKYDLIFAPRNLIARNVYTWTKEWEIPEKNGFSIATFLFLTGKNNGYVFYNEYPEEENYQLLFDNFPSNFSVHEGTESFDEKNYHETVYITYGDNRFTDVNHEGAKFVNILPDDQYNFFRTGTVCYCDDYSCDSCEGEVRYMGSASLYGAIFSMDAESYNCTMNKALDKFRMVLLLQAYRINSAVEAGSLSTSCVNYLGINGGLEGPKQWLHDLNESLDVNGIEELHFETIMDSVDDIHARNRLLILERGCIQLY